ncbi:MAG: DoxX-like family protein [Acidobacteriota bacterium]
MSGQPGIYVEILISEELERIWQLTQEPDLHARWDLRFTRIQYLPRTSPAEPQRFLYQTRIGFGLAIEGTGESVGDRSQEHGDVTSSLKFASNDPKSLIRNGAGYWKYVPTDAGLRFFTWYDYEVRFGAMGRLVDRLAFRPLIGWATAWSFDRLRLWVENQQSPETSMTVSLIHAIARLSIAFIWIWQGLVPKLLFRNIDEGQMLVQAGLSVSFLPWIGAAEILIGVLVLCAWRTRAIFIANALAMVLASVVVVARSPYYLTAAFNPVTLNLGVFALAITGWLASKTLPSALNCLRVNPRS